MPCVDALAPSKKASPASLAILQTLLTRRACEETGMPPLASLLDHPFFGDVALPTSVWSFDVEERTREALR